MYWDWVTRNDFLLGCKPLASRVKGMKNIKQQKRLLTQLGFFLLQNPMLQNFAKGEIYQGNLKLVCSPGLNCYSCPAAVTSCPIGALQFFLAGVRRNVSMYAAGFLLITGAVFGRLICGFVCPMGLLQDLLYKIKTPKYIARFRFLRYIKYLVLALFVFILPYAVLDEISGLGEPWFCKYLCPSGTIFGAIPLLAANDFLRGFLGVIFSVKVLAALGIIIAATVIYRFFCRVLCPLGAIYSLFNKIALINIRCDKYKCVLCGSCQKVCYLRLDPAAQPNSPECVRCGNCLNACGAKALAYSVARK